MKQYIALLRGINVSGQKKVPMAELRELLTKSGLSEVKTYIQSGNVVFKHSSASPEKLKTIIQNSIKVHFGFEVQTFVTELDYIQHILTTNPFSEAAETKGNLVFATMLSEVPDPDLKNEFSKLSYPDEYFELGEQEVYFYFPNGGGRAKLNNNFIERKLKVAATTRNWKTLKAIAELCKS